MREVRVAGFEALQLTTSLLQRVRRADPFAGVWEASDVQWSWRRPRESDAVEKLFWIDADGPVAGVFLESGPKGGWRCDPIVVPGASDIDAALVWSTAIEHVEAHAKSGFDVPVEDDDQVFSNLALRSRLVAAHHDSTAWMRSVDWQGPSEQQPGFRIVDRARHPDSPHPMQSRNGIHVAQRLLECPLYDPELDLAIVGPDGRIAGYSLFWFDPITDVGLVEPVRVEDEFQRRGLARTMLATGIDRLVARGAERVKISYETEAAAALYRGVGFRATSTTTWFRRDQA